MKTKKDTKNLLCLNGIWYLRATIKGAVVKQSLGTRSLAVAQKERDARLAGLKGTADKKALLQSVEVQLLGMDELEKREKEKSNLGLLLCEMFNKFVKDTGRRPVKAKRALFIKSAWTEYLEWMMKSYPYVQYARQVTKAMGREFMANLRDECLKSNTFIAKACAVRQVWNSICNYDDNLNNPFGKINFYGLKDSVVKQTFSDDELKLIFRRENNPEFRLLSGFLFYFALRFSEAVNCTWEQCSDGYFNGTHTKTGADATTRIPPQILELMSDVPGEHTGLLFPSYNVGHPNHKYMEDLRKLGIITSILVPNGKGGEKLVCIKGAHSFRHTVITNSLRNGQSAAAVRRLAGHATEAMQAHYTHLNADDAGNVSESLGKFW